MAGNVVALKPTRPCPICGKPSTQQFHPFCSGRCADIDLNRWLSGAYVIPGDTSPDDEQDTPSPATSDDGDGD
jgi:endogenous inhibitor of DNA gyrase (YacG/DUF329 family)